MNLGNTNLALAPLGAGDLIDRAVRLYRRHFLTLIRIAAPPVLVSAVGSTLTTIAFRAIGATPSAMRLFLYILRVDGWRTCDRRGRTLQPDRNGWQPGRASTLGRAAAEVTHKVEAGKCVGL
jgi:hypothetical protein